MNFKLQKEQEIKQKIEEERKKMFKPTIDTNSCKLAAKTEGVFEKAMVRQKVDQTHMVDYYKAEEVFEDKKQSKLKNSNGKQSPPRQRKPKETQTKLPGTKQDFDNVRSKYMDALVTPRKKQTDSPVSKPADVLSSGKRALQAKQAAGLKQPAHKKPTPHTAGAKKQPAEARASKSRSSGRARSDSAGKRLERSPPRLQPDPRFGMKGQQVYHSSKYFSSLNEQLVSSPQQTQSSRPRTDQLDARSNRKTRGSPRDFSPGKLIAQASDEEVEIFIQDEDRSPSPSQPRAPAPRQSALEAKRVKTYQPVTQQAREASGGHPETQPNRARQSRPHAHHRKRRRDQVACAHPV